MSDTEFHKGKIKRLHFKNDQEINEFFYDRIKENRPDYTDEKLQELYNKEYTYQEKRNGKHITRIWYVIWEDYHIGPLKYLMVNGIVYKIDDKSIDDFDETILTKTEEDEFEYISSFYNGGTCLCEELHNALNKIK